MTRKETMTRIRAFWAGCVLALLCGACAHEPQPTATSTPSLSAEQVTSGYIIQAASTEIAAAAVEAVGGEVTHELGIIQAVGATLRPEQVETLERRSDVRRIFDHQHG